MGRSHTGEVTVHFRIYPLSCSSPSFLDGSQGEVAAARACSAWEMGTRLCCEAGHYVLEMRRLTEEARSASSLCSTHVTDVPLPTHCLGRVLESMSRNSRDAVK